MVVSAFQMLISLGYVVGAVNCARENPDPALNITMTLSNCLLLVHPLLLCVIRYKHPKVKRYIKKLFER